MKKLFGFTLAEILITLGIVGVVAALTIPTFTTNSQRQAYAKSLAVAVSDFETAMKNMMEREDVDNIKETQAWLGGEGQNLVNNLSSFLPIDSLNANARTYRLLNSSNTTAVEGNKYRTKKGIEYFITFVDDENAANENNALASGSDYTEQAATVTIDINGADLPNMIGRDLFCYELGINGTLYPVGSKDYNFHQGNGAVSDNFNNGCSGNDLTSNCGEYLRRNGYKMDY